MLLVITLTLMLVLPSSQGMHGNVSFTDKDPVTEMRAILSKLKSNNQSVIEEAFARMAEQHAASWHIDEYAKQWPIMFRSCNLALDIQQRGEFLKRTQEIIERSHCGICVHPDSKISDWISTSHWLAGALVFGSPSSAAVHVWKLLYQKGLEFVNAEEHFLIPELVEEYGLIFIHGTHLKGDWIVEDLHAYRSQCEHYSMLRYVAFSNSY